MARPTVEHLRRDLERLGGKGYGASRYPRRFEVAAALNRLRSLRVKRLA